MEKAMGRRSIGEKAMSDAERKARWRERHPKPETLADALRRENEQAIARGVFGSPFVIVDGEPFWGLDHLDQVDRWLATGGW